MSYSKPAALEYIFIHKFDPQNPQQEIPFTRDEVRNAIIATGGAVPLNLNNFVKDLTRTGASDARSSSAREAGYFLREGTHTGSIGVFFRDSGPLAGAIAVICPGDLEPKKITLSLPSETHDLLRPDEGGLLAVLEYGHLLDDFFDMPQGTIKRVQSPVKVQPHEVDGFFVMKQGHRRIPIPCEAKSQGNDVITLSQIVGVAAAALQRLLEDDMAEVIPIGAKIESNGDVFIARFPECTIGDLLGLNAKLTASSVVKQVRYRLDPKPPKW
jgi:hypothetical protein